MTVVKLVKMFESCREFANGKDIVCEEKRTKITFRNSTGKKVEKICIDGCVITDNNVKKCDYLLVCAEVKKAVFVELKGNKVMTAIEQLSATLDNKTIKTPLKEYTKVAYAVVAKVPSPRVSTRIQTKQNDFKGNKQCTLKVVESSHTYDFVSGKAVK